MLIVSKYSNKEIKELADSLLEYVENDEEGGTIMENKFIEFLNNENSIILNGVRDFQMLNKMFREMGLNPFYNAYWHKPENLKEWKPNWWDLLELAINNNKSIDYTSVIVEYQLGKGLSLGYTRKESERWFGMKPWSVKEVKHSIA